MPETRVWSPIEALNFSVPLTELNESSDALRKNSHKFRITAVWDSRAKFGLRLELGAWVAAMRRIELYPLLQLGNPQVADILLFMGLFGQRKQTSRTVYNPYLEGTAYRDVFHHYLWHIGVDTIHLVFDITYSSMENIDFHIHRELFSFCHFHFLFLFRCFYLLTHLTKWVSV